MRSGIDDLSLADKLDFIMLFGSAGCSFPPQSLFCFVEGKLEHKTFFLYPLDKMLRNMI